MADEELRSLQRDARSDPQTCRRLARAYERAGRSADALAALVAGAADLGVRREASRYPRDSAPILVVPRVRWQTTPDGRDTLQRLLATPLAVVFATSRRTLLIDLDTGEQRMQLPPGFSQDLDEVLFLLRDSRHVAAYDLWTGQELYVLLLGSPCSSFRAGPDRLIVKAAREVRAFGIEDPRLPPRHTWSARARQPFGLVDDGPGDLVLIYEEEAQQHQRLFRVIALDARDGSERFRMDHARSFLADQAGIVLDYDDGGLASHGPDGVERWRRTDLRLSPRRLRERTIHSHGERGRLVTLDRESGATIEDVPLDQGWHVLDLYQASGTELVARGPDGASRWRWPFPGDVVRAPWSMQALPGRLVVAVGDRTVACLEPNE